MEFAYFDESGDLGANGSKKLVMCLVCTNEKKKINKIIRRAKQGLLRKKKTADWYNRKSEIKFYSFPDNHILLSTLEELGKVDIKIYYQCLNKEGINFSLKSKNVIMGHLFWHIFEHSNKEKPQKIISDLDFFSKKPSYFALIKYEKKNIEIKSENGKNHHEFINNIDFMEISKDEYELNKNNKDKLVIKIEPMNSRLSEELQAVDLICGSIFQYLENGDTTYYDLIKSKIVKGEELKSNK